MKISVRIIILAFLCQATPLFASPPDWLDRLKQQFQHYWQKQQPQNVYLRLDRSLYAASDTVWFKAYLTDAATQRPQVAPEVIYLNLISPANKNVLTRQIRADKGFADGSILLPDSLKTGTYLLQAYTTWQTNIGPQQFFRQPVFIAGYDAGTGKAVANTAKKVLPEIQFYPDGGNLLAGFENKVVFKTSANYGSGLPVQGTIVDESGKTILSFQDEGTGSGSFNFKPAPGKKYTAHVQAGKQSREIPLPVSQSGYALKVDAKPDSVWLTIGAAAGNRTAPVGILLQGRGNLLVSDSVLLNENGLRKRAFSVQNWPAGTLTAALVNANGTVLNESTFGVKQPARLKVKLEADRKIYGRRDPVKVNVLLTDEMGRPVEADFSVAVTVNGANGKAGLFDPFLRSVGSAENLAGNNNSPQKPEVNDNLLLTGVQSPFSWKDLPGQETKVPVNSRETDLKAQGLVTANNAPLTRAVIYLLDTKTKNTHLVIADQEGKFPVPPGVNRLFYQVWQNGELQEDARLEFLPIDAMLPEQSHIPVMVPDSAALARTILRMKIDKAFTNQKDHQLTREEKVNMWPVYPAGKYYPMENYEVLKNLEEVLREIVPVVRIRTKGQQVKANVYNEDTRTYFPHDPLFIIDGQPTWNHDLMLRLDATQISQVNVYTTRKTLEPFGALGNQGVIVVFTKSRDFKRPELETDGIWNITGHQAIPEFKAGSYSPRHPDLRPTLFWNPALRTNPAGQADFSFQTSDEAGNLRIRVEGITKDGKIISEELLVPVRPTQ